MRIGEFARRGHVSEQTVRYYERRGLLQKPGREASGYRSYAEADVRQLHFIRHAKQLGFTLDQIGLVLDLREQEACPCDEVLRIGEERLAQLDSQIAALSKFRRDLGRAVDRWKACPEREPSGDAICVLIEQAMGPPEPSARTRRKPDAVQGR